MSTKEQIFTIDQVAEFCESLFRRVTVGTLHTWDKRHYKAFIEEQVKKEPTRIHDVVGQSEQFICPCCGSDRTYKTEAYHCNRCAVTTEI